MLHGPTRGCDALFRVVVMAVTVMMMTTMMTVISRTDKYRELKGV